MTVVFYPYTPFIDLSDLVAGTVMILAASIVIHRIYKNSKNTFAYTLMVFTLTMGVSNIGFACTDAFV